MKELLPYLKELNSKWEVVEATNVKTSVGVFNTFYQHLRKKLKDQRRLSMEVENYKKKQESDTESDMIAAQNEFSADVTQINTVSFEQSPERSSRVERPVANLGLADQLLSSDTDPKSSAPNLPPKKRESKFLRKFGDTYAEQVSELEKLAHDIRQVNAGIEDLKSVKRIKKDFYKKCLSEISAKILDYDETVSADSA